MNENTVKHNHDSNGQGFSKEIILNAMLESHTVAKGELYHLSPRYECTSTGVYYIGIKTDRNSGTVSEAEPLFLSDPIRLIGRGVDTQGNYYRVIEWSDRLTRQVKQAAIPQAEIGTNAGWNRLQGYGLSIMSGRLKRERLADYLQREGESRQYSITDKAGWHGSSYILPSGDIISPDKRPPIIYQGDKSQAAAYAPSGTLAQWQADIARYAAGNSRLCLALGTAFAAPLLSLLNEESGGFHIYGDSSDGKTTAARVSLSVWARPSESMMTWQGTGLGFNNTATARNDGLLVLDEISQATPKVIGSTVYSIMNGINKAQGAKDGGNRALSRWRVMVLSTGEKTPDHILQHGHDWNAGQAARLPSIPAATQYGIYETLHGFSDGALLSEHLKEAAERHHGEAGRAFIRLIDTNTPAATQERVSAFMATLPHLSGQARRVAKRFALCAAALELAAPVTGLPAGVGMAGVKQCFDDWFALNGSGKHEDRMIIKQAEDFFSQTADSVRFDNWPLPKGVKTRPDIAGYITSGINNGTEYLLIPAVFEKEVCGTFHPQKVCAVLHSIGWMNKPSGKGWKVQKKQNMQHYRFYSFNGMTPPGGYSED